MRAGVARGSAGSSRSRAGPRPRGRPSRGGSGQQLRDQLETNLFGVFHVTQAVLPILREQGSGHIIQVSTIGGVAAFPSLGGYHASKWALEGMTEALSQEVAGLGIKVTLVEPGGFATDWAGSSAVFADPQPA
ncbi:SDR family NAD(P)-dependent oxidoreductase [Curtobacterium sp. MCLR17_036]|uniref:SDR family NAD(P)-dependent oxidoreductase n=1 Tax=Curtobacterium sp. MCLR17_036 TaxID=2175620 RepID=UPI001C64D568|nr:SDR family NAD(P)-dependent oxidoreductase [Curtobacterium sp. MCLR17_036]WIE66686.1 SDR family NAD(P)-dependent oxidoreductase [Curtobacterium sp. MCLR17_036]